MLQGLLIGFFFGLFALFWFKEQGIFTKRQQMGKSNSAPPYMLTSSHHRRTRHQRIIWNAACILLSFIASFGLCIVSFVAYGACIILDNK